MKRLTITFLCALGLAISLLAQSQAPPQAVQAQATKSAAAAWGEPTLKGATAATGTAAPQPAVQRQAPRKALSALPGSLVEIDHSATNGAASARAVVRITPDASGDSAIITNLWNLGDTLRVAYNLATGKFNIRPKQVYDHPTYGPIWICWFSNSARQYATNRDIEGTINADGTITLGGWGVFVTTGSYAGSAFGAYTSSDLKPTNGVMHDTIYNGTDASVKTDVLTYPVYLDSVSRNEVRIVNFANNGAVVSMYLNSDRTVEITPQMLFANSMYGDFYCYGHDWTTSNNQRSNITGTGTDTQILLGQWGAFARGGSVYARGVLGSTLTFGSGTVTYPQPAVLTWSGDGTQASPYLITTPEQFMAFRHSVAGGNSYMGRYIALGADIDMNNLSETYRPVGNNLHPFNGNFNGQGHTIKGLAFSVGDEACQGLFGRAGDQSVIANVNLSGFNVTSYGESTGLLAGYTTGTVSNITVTGSTLNHQNSFGGGVVGFFAGPSISNVSFTGNVRGYGETGGVIGHMQGGTATGLDAHGAVTMQGVYSSTYLGVGGVIGGTLERAPIVIEKSFSTATVSGGNRGNAGGLVGDLSGGTVDQCFNVGAVSGEGTAVAGLGSTTYYGRIGGLLGRAYGVTVTNSYNAGIVVNSGAQNRYVGGLVGHVVTPMVTYTNGVFAGVRNPSKFIACYNSGEAISPLMNSTMGLYGTCYSDTVMVNTYFDQQITGNVMPDASSPAIKSTAQLTSADALPGFDQSSVWTLSPGLYPQLTALSGHAEQQLAASPIFLAGGESTRKVKTAFAVSSANDIVWRLFNMDNNTFVTSTKGLTMSGDSVKINNVNSSEVLAAQISGNDNLIKLIMLETCDPSAFRGSGTQDDPYLISDKDDLIKLNQGVTQNGQNYQGDFFRQTNDIDLAYATDFTGIGPDNNALHTFAGTYDGQGYSIHRFAIDGVKVVDGQADDDNSRLNAGFFGIVGAKGTVRNLKIAADCRFYAYRGVGAVAGVNQGTIENCRNYATVKACYGYAGGIAGTNSEDATVTGCYNEGQVLVGGVVAAGIVALNNGTVTGSQNVGRVATYSDPYSPVTNTNEAAGIVGYGGEKSLTNGNLNAGQVEAGNQVAGIVATYYPGAQMRNNITYGIIVKTDPARDDVGAITSRMFNSTDVVSGNYYDEQLNYMGGVAQAPYPGVNGLTTASLTSGAMPDSLPAANYDVQAGIYPILARFADEPGAQAQRRLVLNLPSPQSIDDVSTGGTVADTATWALQQGKAFTVANGKLQVAIAGDSALRDTLTATFGGYSRVIPLRAMPTYFAGSGTQDDPFQIRDKNDMLTLARVTVEDEYPFSGRYFKVMNNIDFDTTAYVPVGRIEADFDGDGHEFLNINYQNTLRVSSATLQGLFRTVGAKGRVHHLTLRSGSLVGYSRTGGIAGAVYGRIDHCDNYAAVGNNRAEVMGGIAAQVMTGGRIDHCHFNGSFTGSYAYTGGIAGDLLAGGVIDSCVNLANINKARQYIGGIAAQTGGTISRCVNRGEIRGSGRVGGIAGISVGNDSTLHCLNLGTVRGATSGTECLGGIIGGGQASGMQGPIAIIGCENRGAVSGRSYVGGITGQPYGSGVVDSCLNVGDVTGTAKYVGGIGGEFHMAATTVSNCVNQGIIVSEGGYVGGIAGEFYGDLAGHVVNCVNQGSVMGNDMYVSGIAGLNYCRIDRCINYANIEGASYVAGISSYNYGGHLLNSVNLGDLTMTSDSRPNAGVGGVSALCTGGLIQNCYNMGTLNGPAYVAGLVPDTRTSSTDTIHIATSYNAGVLTGNTADKMSQAFSNYNKVTLIDSVFFDTDVNPTVARSNQDELCTGLPTRLMVNAALGEAYVYRTGMYPVLASMADSAVVNWFAAVPVLAQGDSATKVTRPITIGTPLGTVWTCSGNLSISGNTVTATALGAAWLTKTLGQHTRTYNLTVTALSGVESAGMDAPAVVRTDYYSVNGMHLGTTRPLQPGIYVVRETLSNGATRAAKAIVR